jgi:hypothetical protein
VNPSTLRGTLNFSCSSDPRAATNAPYVPGEITAGLGGGTPIAWRLLVDVHQTQQELRSLYEALDRLINEARSDFRRISSVNSPGCQIYKQAVRLRRHRDRELNAVGGVLFLASHACNYAISIV